MLTPTKYRAAFTLIELLVTVAIVAVLAALSLSGLMQAVQAAKQGACLHNIDTLMVAGHTWITDNGGVYPDAYLSGNNPEDVWYDSQLIPNYLPAELRCPLQTTTPNPGIGFRYAYNDSLRSYFPQLRLPVPASRVVFVSEMYYFGDGFWANWHFTATQDGLETGGIIQAHSGGLNIGFLDGHAELIKPSLNSQNQADWSLPPLYAHNLTSGYYYDGTQFYYMAHGFTQW